MYECPVCDRKFSEKTRTGNFNGLRTDPKIIAIALTFLTRYKLTYREVGAALKELFNIKRSHVCIQKWVRRFGSMFHKHFRQYKVKFGSKWHADAMTVTIRGKRAYVWVVRDTRGKMVGSTVTRKKDRNAAARFFRNAKRNSHRQPKRLIMDKCPSMKAAKKTELHRPKVVNGHIFGKVTNNIMEGFFGANLRPAFDKHRGFKNIHSVNMYMQIHRATENLRGGSASPIHEKLLFLMGCP